MLVLFTLLILNANYIQVVRSSELRSNQYNTRILAEEYDRERADRRRRQPVAQSVRTDDALTYLRQYPQGDLYSTVTGYYSLVYGNSGIEDAEDDVLSGNDDRLAFRRIADLFTGRDPSGGNVELTLDPTAQQAAFDGLNGVQGSVVALDPSTGAVLAMVSSPGYDPNQLSSHDPAAIRAYSDQLSAMDPDPRTNGTVAERHSPGRCSSSSPRRPRSRTATRRARSCRRRSSTGCRAPAATCPTTTTRCATQRSADPGRRAAHLVQHRVRPARRRARRGPHPAGAEAFGIDQETSPMPLPVVQSTSGDIDGDAQLAVASIGQQNVQITPLQGAMIAAAIANDGTLMKPTSSTSCRPPTSP